MTRYTNCVPVVGGAETCGGLDTRGLLLVLGHPTKAPMAVAICCTSSAKRSVGGWVAGWPEVVKLPSVLPDGLAGGVELIILVRILHDTTEQLVKQ